MSPPTRRPGRAARAALAALLAAAALVAACGGSATPGAGPAPPRGELTVSAAASLQDVLAAAAALWAREPGALPVRLNLGSSGALAQQILAGAPVDLFVAAGTAPMERLVAAGRVDPAAVRVLARNELVLVVPADGGAPVRDWRDLAHPRVRRVAIGDPAHVPAGQYARAVLEHLGLWPVVSPKLVLDQDVRQVLHHVAAGAVDAGVVYRTDAATAPGVRVVAPAPPGSHPPIAYPLAVIRGTPRAAAAEAFARFLLSPGGQALLREHGFLPPR